MAHRDLKLENFLMAKNGTYKLCDFGSCVEGPQSLKSKEDRAREVENVLKRTTAMYRSPELADVEGTAMFGSGELTEAVDIWAMGCILYTMAFFKPPFPPDGLRTERYTIPETSKYSADVHTLIKRMLTADVELRATLEHVMECIDEMMEGRPIPPLPRAGAVSPRKKAVPSGTSDKKPAATTATGGSSAPTRDSSFGSNAGAKKTTEARKESVPASKPAMDLLDMDFNPTISSGGGAKPAAASTDTWNAPPTNPTDGFANFANFGSPSAAASSSDGGKRMDAFGFPASPVKQQGVAAGATPAFGFAAPVPTSTPLPAPPAVDPFAALGPINNGGHHAPAPMMQGFNQGFHHQPPAQQQQQQQQFYGQQPQGFYPPQQQHQQGFYQPQQQAQQQQMWGAQQQQPFGAANNFNSNRF